MCVDNDGLLQTALGRNVTCDDDDIAQSCEDAVDGQNIKRACPRTCGVCNVAAENSNEQRKCVNSDSATLMSVFGTTNCCYAKMRGNSCSSAEMKQHCGKACRTCTPTISTSASQNAGKDPSSYKMGSSYRTAGSSASSKNCSSTGLIIGLVVAAVVLVACVVAACCLCGRSPTPDTTIDLQTSKPEDKTWDTVEKVAEKVDALKEKIDFGGRECVSAPTVGRSCGVFTAAEATSTSASTTAGPVQYHN